MRLLKNGIKRMKTVVTYTHNQGVSDDDGVVELCDYLSANPTMKVIANTSKDGSDIISYEYTSFITKQGIVFIKNSLGDIFYKTGSTYTIINESDIGFITEPYTKTKLLWENASPTSTFIAQQISFTPDDYDYYIITIYYNSDNTRSYSSILNVFENGVNTRLENYNATRDTAVMNYGIYFGDGQAGGTVNNTYFIPYKIYGIKF